jgi:hypothetical protein
MHLVRQKGCYPRTLLTETEPIVSSITLLIQLKKKTQTTGQRIPGTT